jgi:hypothetical protein
MIAEPAMNFHAAASGSPANGMTTIPHTAPPTTTVAVSSSGSQPGADLSSAFQLACRKPAARTASVIPKVSSGAGIGVWQPDADQTPLPGTGSGAFNRIFAGLASSRDQVGDRATWS